MSRRASLVKKRARRAIKTKRQANPQLELQSASDLRNLRNKLRRAQDAYYNTPSPLISDEKYDQLENRLRAISPNDKVLRRIDSKDTRQARKTTLPYPMPSLDKIKPDESLQKWLDSHPGPYTISDKLDGVSAERTSDDKLYTRGTSGIVGSDISHLIPYIRGARNKLPRGVKAVRGEICFLRDTFTRKYVAKYENARNLVSGVVNKLHGVHEAASDAVFLLHGLLAPAKPLSSMAAVFKQAGYIVLPMVEKAHLDEQFLLEYLAKRREKSKLDIDGLVIAARTGIVAFKAGYASAQAEVQEVEWNESRYGYLKPTVILKKGVRLAGATLTRFTGNNAKMIVDGKIGPGAVIEVTRSGDVIPKIMRVIKPSKRNPYPAGFGSKYEWNDTGVDIVAVGNDKSTAAKVQELVTFLIKVEVDKIKAGNVERLVEHGIDTIPALIGAKPHDFLQAGLGSAAASHLYSRLKAQLKLAELPALMAGSNTFDRGFGETRFTTILDEIDFKQQLTVYRRSRNELIERLAIIPGIGSRTARAYVASLPRFAKFLHAIKWKPLKVMPRRVRKSALGIAPIVVFTGFRDKVLKKQVEAVGGKVANSVTKNTTHVVVLDINHKSEKTKKAERYGARIVALRKFKQLLGKTN